MSEALVPRPGSGPAIRVAVIGDVAGHLDELRAELVRLGAHPASGELPDDLVVVQVGDLVHRGPDSAGVVALVDRYLTEQPDRWVQLVGNHEAQYLRAPSFRWPERLDPAPAETVRGWWESGRMQVATALRRVGGGGDGGGEDVLVTHAGLTVGFWRDVLDRITAAPVVAAALNSLAGEHDDVLFAAGQVLSGRRANRLAGPLWASAATELLPDWLDVHLPFSQVHGHTMLTDWSSGEVRAPDALARRTTVDREAKHETTVLDGGRIIGIDPGHGVRPRRPWRAWEATCLPLP